MNPYDCFSGINIMTPKYHSSGWIVKNKIAYEISTGRWIDDKTIFGLTIRDINKRSVPNMPSKLCYSIREARETIDIYGGIGHEESNT